jgi:hypothetical protein
MTIAAAPPRPQGPDLDEFNDVFPVVGHDKRWVRRVVDGSAGEGPGVIAGIDRTPEPPLGLSAYVTDPDVFDIDPGHDLHPPIAANAR